MLLASDTPETQHDFRELLDGSMTTAHGATLVLLNVADAWGNQGDLEALAALRRMSKLKYFADVFACRRAVVQAMTMIRLPEAIDALVALQPPTVLKALLMHGVGRKTTKRLLALGLLTDAEGVQTRTMTLEELRANRHGAETSSAKPSGGCNQGGPSAG